MRVIGILLAVFFFIQLRLSLAWDMGVGKTKKPMTEEFGWSRTTLSLALKALFGVLRRP